MLFCLGRPCYSRDYFDTFILEQSLERRKQKLNVLKEDHKTPLI